MIKYTVFNDHTIGESHERSGMGCEDYSGSYADPEGRYAIGVICDGHSDAKCFRSAIGARFGCETMIVVLKRWMEAVLEDIVSERYEVIKQNEKEIFNRLKMACVQTWNYKVNEDIHEHPITEEEKEKLIQSRNKTVLEYYMNGKYLNNIYGATMLAVAVCEDFHMALQIGDGIIIRLEEGGIYTVPVEDDDKDEMEGPESLCDGDLISREKAFRTAIYPGHPQAMFVTSDGIGDTPITIKLRERLRAVHAEWVRMDQTADISEGLQIMNKEQKEVLHYFIDGHSKEGVQDDCSLSGFFDPSIPVSEVYFSEEEISDLLSNLEAERVRREKRYLETKTMLQKNYDAYQAQIDQLTLKINDYQKRISDLSGAVTERFTEKKKEDRL